MTLLMPWKKEKLSDIWTWPQILSLNILGIWPKDISSLKNKEYLKILRVFNFSIATFFSLSAVLSIIIKFYDQDITKSLFAIYTAGPICFGDYKLYQIDRHRESLKRAMDLLDELLYETTDPKYMNIMRRRLVRIWYFFITSNFLVCLTLLHWFIRPLLTLVFFGEKTSIYDTWPLFMDTWLQFSLTIIFQIVASFPLTIGYAMFDSIYFCMSELILCHFAILKDKLESWSMNRNNLDSQSRKNLIKVHIKLLEVCNNLRTASEAAMIIQTIICIISYCSGLFIILMGEDVNMNVVINLTESLSGLTIFFYLFCWYSNEIRLQSNETGTSAYLSDWINGSEEEKKTLLILMRRTDSAVIFGGFMKINLETFLNAMKMTFSYYNFLQAVIGKN